MQSGQSSATVSITLVFYLFLLVIIIIIIIITQHQSTIKVYSIIKSMSNIGRPIIMLYSIDEPTYTYSDIIKRPTVISKEVYTVTRL
jgi:thioredoxin-related protein